MKAEAKALIFVAVFSAAALVLAFVFRELNIKQSLADQATVKLQVKKSMTEPSAPVGPSAAILDQESCQAGGGTWQNCGSACRGKALGTACIELCVPICECESRGFWNCPKDYGCREYIKEEGRGLVGICKPGSKEEPPVKTLINASSTFLSKDKVTMIDVGSALLDGRVMMENPTTFSGTSTAFENTINWSLEDSAGTIVSRGFANVSSSDMGLPGPFTITAFYDQAPVMKNGQLRIFESSAKDGSPLHEVAVPVEFIYTQKNGCLKEVNIALVNPGKDPEMLDCAKTFLVKRKICGDISSHDLLAVHELLKGPNIEEKRAGYLSSFPEDVNLPSMSWTRDGKKQFDFDKSLETGAHGSCRVLSMRSQFQQTLEANNILPVGQEAIISVNGRTEDVLQP